MNNNSDFLNKIQELQNNFYSTNQKNMLFKAKQKEECASIISNQLSLEDLLHNTFFIIPNTNKIFIDYLVFKTFIHPSNYNIALNHIISLTTYCINKYNEYEVHINLNTFTISAAQRYKDVVKLYTDYCLSSDTQFSNTLTGMFIYNTPNVMDNIITILGPFIDNTVKRKIHLKNKSESPELIKLLLSKN
jgi:hypothetical protein